MDSKERGQIRPGCRKVWSWSGSSSEVSGSVRNAGSHPPPPDLPNQNLQFSKILQGMCLHVKVWKVLPCLTGFLFGVKKI